MFNENFGIWLFKIVGKIEKIININKINCFNCLLVKVFNLLLIIGIKINRLK